MVKVEIIFFVDKPIERVFDLISDISGYKRWAPDKSKFFIQNKITSEGPIGLGTTYMDQLRWWGKSIGEIVEYQRPSKIKFQQKTLFGIPVFAAKLQYTLKAFENSTEVIHRAEAMPYGFFKLLEPLLSIIVHSERERTCQAIKRSLEGAEGTAPQ
ncbi:MAG: SRPBCC family protein [Desulfobacterales bacterium]